MMEVEAGAAPYAGGICLYEVIISREKEMTQ